jgi:hypothetical protein
MGLWYQDFGWIGGGTVPKDRLNIFNHGGTVQGGYFLVPKRWEITAPTSHVLGPLRQDAGQGDHGQEYMIGTPYYFHGHLNKVQAMIGYRLQPVPTVPRGHGVYYRTRNCRV